MIAVVAAARGRGGRRGACARGRDASCGSARSSPVAGRAARQLYAAASTLAGDAHGSQARRHPDLRPRLQHGGADRGGEGPRLSRRDRARRLQRARTPQGSSAPRAAGIATAIVDHRPFGKDREAFERALQARARGAPHRARLPRRLHAAADALVRRAAGSGRMLNIHPALLPAFKGLDTHARALAAGRRSSTARPCISWCRRWIPGRSSRRARCRCCRATPKRRSPRACSTSSTDLSAGAAAGRGRPRADRRRPLPDRRPRRRRKRRARRHPQQNKTPGRGRGLRESHAR